MSSHVWDDLVEEYEPKLGHRYRLEYKGGKDYWFIGLLHGIDDLYFLMYDKENGYAQLTCVGNLEQGHGAVELVDVKPIRR